VSIDAAAATGTLERRVWAALAEINDPEMPINLVDLGLIYGVDALDGTVRLRLTFTAMGCPATDMIVSDIRERLLAEPGVESVAIDVVWDPPWSSARLTADGRDALLAWGLSV
jgi:metal-sulfur cluster biosynthetic enzyme